ncbi:MAG: HEAT repeat domain-containing protein [Bdellovibrionales bacterium]|nr:HEAT repeat domain-containing protein [Bdellovibrionales bacterium]
MSRRVSAWLVVSLGVFFCLSFVLPKPAEADEEHVQLVRALGAQLVEDDRGRVLSAGVALFDTARKEDVPVLVELLGEPKSDEAQVLLLEVLGRLGDPRAARAVNFEVEHDNDDPVKLAGIDALGRFKHDWAIPALVQYLVHGDSVEIQKRAASALGRIGSSQAIYALESSVRRLGLMKGGLGESVQWALANAKGEIDPTKIDLELPGGTGLKRLYKGMQYSFYHPALRPRDGYPPRMFVCIHDTTLDYDETFDRCLKYGRDQQLAVLVPHFDNFNFPDYATFGIRSKRTDRLLLELVDFLGAQVNVETRQVFLFGHGAGGDFAQRFAMLYPERIARAAMLPRNILQIDRETFFPAGLQTNPFAPDITFDLNAIVRSEILFMTLNVPPTGREGEQFVREMKKYIGENGLFPRVGFKEVGHTTFSPLVLDTAKQFLFRGL